MAESELLSAITKGGIAGIILAALYGVSLLVTAWRGGSASQTKATDTATRLTALEAELVTVKHELAVLMDQLFGMRAMRDTARAKLYVLELKHGEPETIWPPDPPPPVGGTP